MSLSVRRSRAGTRSTVTSSSISAASTSATSSRSGAPRPTARRPAPGASRHPTRLMLMTGPPQVVLLGRTQGARRDRQHPRGAPPGKPPVSLYTPSPFCESRRCHVPRTDHSRRALAPPRPRRRSALASRRPCRSPTSQHSWRTRGRPDRSPSPSSSQSTSAASQTVVTRPRPYARPYAPTPAVRRRPAPAKRRCARRRVSLHSARPPGPPLARAAAHCRRVPHRPPRRPDSDPRAARAALSAQVRPGRTGSRPRSLGVTG